MIVCLCVKCYFKFYYIRTADGMKESVGTAYSENRKVCILAHTDTMHLECATFPTELNNNCHVRLNANVWRMFDNICLFFEGLCEFCYMKQIFNSTIFVKKSCFSVRTMLMNEVC